MNAPARKPLALVVDDDRDYLALVNKLLGKLGFAVSMATTADEFLKKFRAESPQLCLIDLRLGSAMVGFQLLESIRIELKSEIPLFVASAESDTKIIAHAMEMGATDYIVKPIEPETLASKLSPYFISDQIAVNRLKLQPVRGELASGTLSADFTLLGVDENGVTLRGGSLISKGTKIQLASPMLGAITGQGDSHLLTVVNTWADTEHQAYAAYAEFDPEAVEVLVGVRRWLVSRTLT